MPQHPETGTMARSVSLSRQPVKRYARIELEQLEDRLTPAAGLQEQYMLELINRMRENPAAELPILLGSNNSNVQNALNYFGVNTQTLQQQWASLSAAPPLAWNDNLASSASSHNQAMIAAKLQSHQVPGEAALGSRLTTAGYSFSYGGENIFAYSTDVFYAHAAFAIDWGSGPGGIQNPAGHRNNIMSTNFREVGINVASSTGDPNFGPLVITQDFGSRSNQGNPYFLGSIYGDTDKDTYYSYGEGLSGVSLLITNTVTGATTTTTTTAAGGFQVQLAAGTYSVAVSGGNFLGTATRTITIGSNNVHANFVNGTGTTANAAPTLQAIATQTIAQGGNAVVTLVGADANNDALSYTARVLSASPTATINLSVVGNQLTVTPPTSFAGVANIEVTVSDGKGGTAVQTFALSVTALNAAPTLQTIPTQTIAQGGNAVVTLVGADANNDALAYSARVVTASPTATLTLGIVGNQLTVTPPTSFAGTANIEVTVSDGKGGTAVQSFVLNVAAPNAPPTLQTIPTQNILKGGNAVVTLVGADANNDPLTYSARVVSATPTATLTLNIAGNKLTVTPPATFVGTANIEVSVGDGKGGYATQTFVLNVTAPNVAPTLTAIPTQTITKGGKAVVTLVGADANNDALTYSARVVSATPTATLTLSIAGNKLTVTPPTTFVGSANIEVSVGDGKGGYATQTFVLNVTAPNVAPTLTAIPTQTITKGGKAIITLVGADANNDALTYTARVVSASPVATLTLSVAANMLTVTPPATFVGTSKIEVTVRDAKGLTAVQSFTLNVQAPPKNTAPVLGALPAVSLFSGQTGLVNLSATDAENNPVAFTAQIVGANTSTVAIVGKQLTISTASGYVGGFDVVVVASDGLLTSSKTLRVTVTAEPTVLERLAGDFNGDGKGDVLTVHSDGSLWVAQFNSSNAVLMQRWGQLPNLTWSKLQAGDFNGDGKTDLLGISSTGTFTVAASTGTAFTVGTWGTWSAASNYSYVVFGDFNGDKKLDVAGLGTNGYLYVQQSTGTSFTLRAPMAFGVAADWTTLQVGDFNGDGRTDLATIHRTGYWYVGFSNNSATGYLFDWQLGAYWGASSNWTNYQVGDFNGDGRADVASQNVNGAWYFGLSNGSTSGYYFTNVLAATWSAPSTWNRLYVADINNDGKMDLVAVNSQTNAWYAISLRNGEWTTLNLGTNAAIGSSWSKALTTDVNSDKLADAVQFALDGSWYAGQSNGSSYLFTKIIRYRNF